jgi:hypothetical protein
MAWHACFPWLCDHATSCQSGGGGGGELHTLPSLPLDMPTLQPSPMLCVVIMLPCSREIRLLPQQPGLPLVHASAVACVLCGGA